jgi:hypothetical protein
MAAIDLLFDHKGDSERLHQVVLSVLLLRSRLLAEILGVPGLRATDFKWEAEGRLFDLGFTVHDPSGAVEQVFVELKIDSNLTEAQFVRQLEHTRQHKKARLLYLVLGLTQISVTPQQLSKWSVAKPPVEPSPGPAFCYCDAHQLAALLANPRSLLVAGDPTHDYDVRDLLVGYRDALDRLVARTTCFAERPTPEWQAPDFCGFFADCQKHHVGQMAQAGISYEANPRGGFIACHWLRTPIHPSEPLRLYLQMENAKLCLKLKVPDEYKSKRKKLWDAAGAALRTLAPKFSLKIEPSHYHSGIHMTFATIPEVLPGERLDRKAFTAKIEAAEALLREVAAKLLT